MRLAVSGVLFDLDGTLLDTSGPIFRSWTTWAGEHDVSAEDFARVGSHGRRSVDLVDALVPADRAGAALARIHALELDDLEGIVPVAGAGELLSHLPPHLWGIVTSGDRRLARARLLASDLAFAVDRLLVTGDEVDAGKPDPGPYLAGAAALGVSARECLVVEDAPAGIASGLAAGARTLGLTTTVTPDELSRAHVVVADLRAVGVLSVGAGIVLTVEEHQDSRTDTGHPPHSDTEHAPDSDAEHAPDSHADADGGSDTDADSDADSDTDTRPASRTQQSRGARS